MQLRHTLALEGLPKETLPGTTRGTARGDLSGPHCIRWIRTERQLQKNCPLWFKKSNSNRETTMNLTYVLVLALVAAVVVQFAN